MPRGKKKSTNKMDAMRQALDELGKNAMPKAIQSLVKQKHGIDMSTTLISNYKHHLLGGKRKGKRGRKPGPKPAAGAAVGAGRTGPSKITLEDIQAVKKLVDQMGAEKVQQLALVLAK